MSVLDLEVTHSMNEIDQVHRMNSGVDSSIKGKLTRINTIQLEFLVDILLLLLNVCRTIDRHVDALLTKWTGGMGI